MNPVYLGGSSSGNKHCTSVALGMGEFSTNKTENNAQIEHYNPTINSYLICTGSFMNNQFLMEIQNCLTNITKKQTTCDDESVPAPSFKKKNTLTEATI